MTFSLFDVAFVGSLSAAPALWTPADITTALWLDAADASTVTTVSGAVSQWNDKSGNGRHCSQSSASLRPIYATGAINGQNSIEFSVSSAAGHFLNGLTASPLGLITKTLFLVAEETTHVDFAGIVAVAPASGSDSSTASGFITQTGASSVNHELRIDGSTSTSYSLPLGPFQAMRRLIIAEVKQSGSGTLFVNGSSIITDSSFTEFSALSGQGYLLGARFISGAIAAGNRLRGHISEVIYLESSASTDIRQRTEGYLAHKWGLSANLPADHPYKSAAPIL